MPLDRTLQLNTTALALLGAAFLGVGHANFVMPLVLIVAALAAMIVTDWQRWIQLNRTVGNVIALAAVAASLWNFLELESEHQLLAIANMLVCLQVVLLFQEKVARVYWQLLVLSLLQVVVAAALSLGPIFGMLLLPYLILALTHLILLCLFRDLDRPRLAAPHVRREAAWQSLLLPPDTRPTGVRAADLRFALAGWTLAGHVGLMALVSLLFTAVFFYATPRLNDAAWIGARGRAITGLPSEVKLKESGSIQVSDQVVMRALLSRMSDRQPLTISGEPYFTALTLTEYQNHGGVHRWLPSSTPRSTPRPRRPGDAASLTGPSTFAEHPRPTLLVRQDIVLENGQTQFCPAILPIQKLNETPQTLAYRRLLNRLERVVPEGEQAAREFRYAIATPAVRGGYQLRAAPHPNPYTTQADFELAPLVQFDAEQFPRLAEVAARALRDQIPPPATQLERAQTLERHFHAPGLYQYSLNLPEARQADLDPIEDFVANHRTGYCEYFASALVLMLRSQGIPARMVIGFKGGEVNLVGRYYVVKQRHAHAWVEAWMPPGEVPVWEIAGQTTGGVWYRLDPTPGVEEVLAAQSDETLVRRLSHAFDYVDLLWREYVLSLTKTRQERAVYDPMTSQATALPSWLEARNVHRWLRRWSGAVGLEFSPPQRNRPRAFEAGLAILVAGAILLLFGVVQAALFARHRVVRWWSSRKAQRAVKSHAPAFYWRLERLLAALPLCRRAGQTPQELAQAAAQRLSRDSAGADLACVPADVVGSYYRVRFGAARLDKTQQAAIEHALDRLAPAVRQARH